MRALRFALAAAAALVEASIAIALVFTSNQETNPWLIAPFAVSAGMSFVAAGLVALWRRPDNATGFWLAATGYLWFIAALGDANQSWVWTVGFCINNLAFVAFVALILAYPDGTLSRRDKWLVGIGGATAIGANTIAALVDPTPTTSCPKCPESAIAIADLPGLKNAVIVVGTVIVAFVLIAVVGVLVQRWRLASPAQRRLLRPVFGSCAISVVLLLVSILGDRIDATAYSAIWVLFLLSFMAVPLTFLAGVLRSRFDRGAIAPMLVSLEAGAPLRDTLANALHDPSLEIVYWLDDRSQWVDVNGHRVEEPRASRVRSVTTVERHGHRIAALVHDPVLDNEPELVRSLSAAAALALQTERLQAELRAQFEFLTTIVNTAPSLLVVLGTDGSIRNQNQAVLEASGYSDEELVRGRYFWDVFIDPDEREEVRERFARAAPDFAPAEYENIFTNVHGEQRVVAWRSAPVTDESGEVISLIAGGIDITDRKHQELELRASEERLRAVIRSSPVGIVEVGVDGRLRSWNPAAEQIFGYTAEEVASGPLYLVPEERSSEYEALLERVRAGESYIGHETARIRKDGTLVDVEVSSAPIRDSAGGFVGHMALFADITERKQRELQLQKERDITETLMRAIPSIVVVVDAEAIIVDSGVDETRAGVNEAFRQAFGWPDAELVHRSVLDFIDDADAGNARTAIASAADGVASPEQESRWIRASGERRVIAWRATPIADVTGRKASLMLLSGVDVTDRKRHEEEIRASRARIVQTADETRRRLERDLHDGAQQRLVALSVSLRLAETKLASDTTAATEILVSARDELAHALEELRELARGIHPAVLTDRGLAAAIEGLVARTPLPVELELTNEPLPPAVEAALYYVVSEALTNVVKYAQATSACVRLEVNGHGTVSAEVSDDGIGGADPARGSGLRGLVDRVEALDGRLTVESPETGGTRVRVEVPLS